ncbi:MAG: hypothetical protein ACXAEU_04180 [Candidatus Hodarchaeales archaeon]|jgi:hypothetical protein
MENQSEFIRKHSSSSYIIAVPDEFMLTKIPDLEDFLDNLTTDLGIPRVEIARLSRTLDIIKSESSTLINEMSDAHWLVFAILQHFRLVIHEFSATPGNEQIINILASGKQQRIEQILSGHYK